MVSIKNAVIPQTEFVKIATYKLSKNISNWNEEIIEKFYEDVNYIPREYNVDIVVKNIDEDKGYAKGSIVVSYNKKQINFPIIVNQYQLSPFDVFASNENGEVKYYPADENNVSKTLFSQQVGKPEDINQNQADNTSIKSVGGIYPKTANTVGNVDDASYPTFAKISGWNKKISKEDLEKFAQQLETDPTITENFMENTGDLVTNLIDLETPRVTTNDDVSGDLDVGKIIQAKQAITTIDSQFFDVNQLQPMTAPAVCELRIYTKPSVEQFIESGSSAIERFEASKNGTPVAGVILDRKDQGSCVLGCEPCNPTRLGDDTVNLKELKVRRDQIFISLDGKIYSEFSDYDKTGFGFYGLKTLTGDKALEQAVGMIKQNTNSNPINTSQENRSDGADKSFAYVRVLDQGARSRVSNNISDNYGIKLIVIYGAGNAYECITFSDKFRKIKINNNDAFVSNDTAVLPANIVSVQKVSSVKNPIYKMALGNVKDIFLIPERSVIINAQMMTRINSNDDYGFMTPSKTVKKIYEDAGINNVKLAAFEEGYAILGRPFEPLKKIANLNGPLSTKQTIQSLMVMGVSKEMAKTAMETALNKLADTNCKEKAVSIFGVNDNYINVDALKSMEKKAGARQTIKDICENIKVDLVKVASELTDPAAVDVVLSLNFINSDSLNEYIENIDEMQDVINQLSKILIASRMGLTIVNESAVKKAIDGINEVVKNLEQVKIAIGK